MTRRSPIEAQHERPVVDATQTIVNTEQADAWNGYEGQHWAAEAERYDAVNDGFNDRLLAAAQIGQADRVLDIGCGTGKFTRVVARAAMSGHVTGVDLSQPMLTAARERAAAENVSNVSFEQGDAQVHRFPAAAHDVAVSRFGIMFFSDPVAAFANIRSALGPAGRLAFVCMTDLEGTDLGEVMTSIFAHLPPVPVDDGGPASLADPGRIRSVLTAAGFGHIECVHTEAIQTWGSTVSDAARFIGDWGPIRHHLELAPQQAAARARRGLTEALQRFEHPDGIQTCGTAWLVTASGAGSN